MINYLFLIVFAIKGIKFYDSQTYIYIIYSHEIFNRDFFFNFPS
jgi:hypothetical protein